MRFITTILIIYISLLTISPAVCGIYAVLDQTDQCCTNTKKCSESSKDNNKKSQNNSPCTPCCFMQNCNCYFTDVSQFIFQSNITARTKKIQSKNVNIVSNYSSDCWHPPEMI